MSSPSESLCQGVFHLHTYPQRNAIHASFRKLTTMMTVFRATVLARAIATEGFNAVSAGLIPKDVHAGINAAVKAVVADLERQSKPVTTNDEIKQVGACCTTAHVVTSLTSMDAHC